MESEDSQDVPQRKQEARGSNEHERSGAGDEGKEIDTGESKVSSGNEDERAELRRQERRRQMNTIHSRRKRERQKIEVEVLREQCAQYSAQNLSLFHSNRRLEELLEKAKHAIEQHERQFGGAHNPSIPQGSPVQQQPAGLSFEGVAHQQQQLNQQPPPAQQQLDPLALQALQLLLMQQLQQQPQQPAPPQFLPPPQQFAPAAVLPPPAPVPPHDIQDSTQQQQLLFQQLLLQSGMSPDQIILTLMGQQPQVGESSTAEQATKEDDLERKPPPKEPKG